MEKKLGFNPWGSLTNQIIKTILLSSFVFCIVQLVKHLMPPPSRNSWFDFSYIIALVISIILVLIMATYWGWILAKKKHQIRGKCLLLGRNLGRSISVFINLICFLTTSSKFHLTMNWLFKSLADLVILSYIVGVCVLGGFSLQKQDWGLLLLVGFLLVFGSYAFLWYYRILF